MAAAAVLAAALTATPGAAEAAGYNKRIVGPFENLDSCTAASVSVHDPLNGFYASGCWWQESATNPVRGPGYYYSLWISLD